MKKIFLGGTCNNSLWRNELIKLLTIDYFNPVVENWTPECQAEEVRQRQECDYCLYVITPRMKGVFSIAEVVDDSNNRPEKTLFCVLSEDIDDDDSTLEFSNFQLKSLKAVGKMVTENGAKYFESLEAVAEYVNAKQ